MPLLVAGLLLIFDISSLLFVLLIYRISNVEGLSPFLQSFPGFMCVFVALLMAATSLGLVRHLRGLTTKLRRQASLTIAMNVVAMGLLVVGGEGTLRLLHEISMRQPTWHMNFPMMRNWEGTSAQFRSAIHESNPIRPYHEYDPVIGWVIGKNRRSSDGLYSSSSDGLRSLQPGARLLTWSRSDPVALLAHAKPYRVALVGDSFTFGYEVAYEESWAHLINSELGNDFHVLNFGVIGYSVNQARLKYERDVKPTHPDIVVLSVISHNFLRDMFIYNFMFAPDFLTLPYARPRPILGDGRLTILNSPLPSPKEIFNTPDVHKLPYLAYDMNYNWLEWERSPWYLLQHSFLFRLLTSWDSGPSLARQETFDVEVSNLGQQVLKAFIESVRRDGAMPIVVYFPDRFELDSTTPPPHHMMLAPKILLAAGVDYIDATACIKAVPPDRRFRVTHYSVESNAALSKCLPEMILRKFADERFANSKLSTINRPENGKTVTVLPSL